MSIAQALVSFVLAAGLLTVTPGLDTALVLRTSMAVGPRQAGHAALGVVLGCLLWGGAVAVGLGTLLAASSFAFAVLKWIGAAYLFGLGLHLILRPRTRFSDSAETAAPAMRRPSDWFWKGLLQNLLNPKIGVFYVSFLPQFVPPGVAFVPFTFVLAAIHAGLGVAWFAGLILATRPLAQLFRRPGFVKTMDRLTGCLFIGFGAKLALARH